MKTNGTPESFFTLIEQWGEDAFDIAYASGLNFALDDGWTPSEDVSDLLDSAFERSRIADIRMNERPVRSI